MAGAQDLWQAGAEQGQRPPLVRLRGISKRFGHVVAVKPLDLEIHSGDFYALLGPSGCGKTTLLRIIGGFTEPTTGTVEIDGVDVTRLGPESRPTNMVFQGYGLFPHMTVRQNIAYGLRIGGVDRDEIRTRVDAIIELVRLGEVAERMPDALSGGQQQRVALARALVMRPRVLLLDEPLAALDLQLRKAMQEELRRIHRSIGGTFVFVTHDQGEAMALANRIAVMDRGACVQEGGPEEIYNAPRTRFISTFIGEANVLPGRRQAGVVRLDGGAAFPDVGPDETVVVVVRPEAILLGKGSLRGGSDVVELEGSLADAVFLGPYVKYRILLDGGEEITAHSSDFALRAALRVGDRLRCGWSLAQHRILAR
jgi:ABC-type Fe3+/spermidine/putrescine transport system ATPase subunit